MPVMSWKTEANNGNIVLPYHGRYPNVKAGTNFWNLCRKCLNLCVPVAIICCLKKTVKPFNIREYDMNNDIMQKCLSHHYRMTLQKSVPAKKVWKISIKSGQL